MNNLDICKAIAELEGYSIKIDRDGFLCAANKSVSFMHAHVKGGYYPDYNPITDLALNCMLRDKYNAEISYSTFPCGRVLIECSWGNELSHFESKEDIPRAVCECILKSKGLWL